MKISLSTPRAIALRAASTVSGKIVSNAELRPAQRASFANAEATLRVPGAGLSKTAFPAASAWSAWTAGRKSG